MAPSPYGVKDALLGLFVGLFLAGLSGYGLYATSAETLQCERGADGRADCRLSRRVLGVPLRHTRLGDVRGGTVEEYYSSPRTVPSGNRRIEGGYTYHVRYDTAAGPVRGAEGSVRDGHQAIVDGLQGFLADRAVPAFEASLGGGPIGLRLALGLLFAIGALCLVNIPFATVKAIRDRARAPAA